MLVTPAQDVSSVAINEMLSLAKGVLYVAVTSDRANNFLLTGMSRPQMSQSAREIDEKLWDICVSVEAREGVTTGISAEDRATTVKVLGEKKPDPQRLITPGHIMPVRVRNGGVLVRNSLPEATIDIVRLLEATDAAAFIDLLADNGEFLGRSDQQQLAENQNIPFITLSSLIRQRLKNEKLVQRVTEARLPTRHAGELRSYVYTSPINNVEHVALVKGDISSGEPVLTRVQSGCTVSDVFGGKDSSKFQIEQALSAIGKRGRGVLVYLRRPLKRNLSRAT